MTNRRIMNPSSGIFAQTYTLTTMPLSESDTREYIYLGDNSSEEEDISNIISIYRTMCDDAIFD